MLCSVVELVGRVCCYDVQIVEEKCRLGVAIVGMIFEVNFEFPLGGWRCD